MTGHAAPLDDRSRLWALLALFMAVFLGSLDQSIANTALPAIASALQRTPAESVWVIHAYQLAVVAVLLPLAALGDRWGARKVFLLGVALFAVAALASACATQLEWLALFRALQGVGAAGVMSVNLALVHRIFPPQQLGRGAGMNALVVGMGYSLGPTVASLLLAVLPWPWLFGLQAPLGALGWWLARRHLPRSEAAPVSLGPYDRWPALLAAVCCASMIFTLSALAQHKDWPWVLGALGLMLGSGAWLLRRQRGHAAPMLPVDLMRLPLFRLSVFTSLSAFTTQGLAFVALPFYFLQLGRPPLETGVLMSVWALVVAVMAPVAGSLSDRHPPAILGGVGLAILSVGMAALWALGAHTPTLGMALAMGVCGMGFGLYQSPNLRAIMASAPAHRSSGASGMVALARLTGQASGAALVAMCFHAFDAQGPDRAVLLGAATAALGAALSLARLRFP